MLFLSQQEGVSDWCILHTSIHTGRKQAMKTLHLMLPTFEEPLPSPPLNETCMRCLFPDPILFVYCWFSSESHFLGIFDVGGVCSSHCFSFIVSLKSPWVWFVVDWLHCWLTLWLITLLFLLVLSLLLCCLLVGEIALWFLRVDVDVALHLFLFVCLVMMLLWSNITKFWAI